MPSDCQCSACACETKTVTRIIDNEKATKLLQELKKEIKTLEKEVANLKRKLQNRPNKKELIRRLKKQLDNMA